MSQIVVRRALALVAIPVAIALELFHGPVVARFIVSIIAVIPLAAYIGVSTGHLASRLGPTYGALFNASFGNLAEMIIAVFAIRAGLLGVVKASLSGSIIGNLLFVLGLSMLAGGWKRESQKFNQLAAEESAGQMVLAAAALLIPALFFRVASGATHPALMHGVSIGTACALIITYACGLWFTFKTHRHLFGAVAEEKGEGEGEGEGEEGELWSIRRSLLTLAGAAAAMAVVAEALVGAVEDVGHRWGLNEVFLGFVVLAIVGNAAENSTAIRFALRDRMDIAVNIVTQASVQIALFVTPVLVLLSYSLGNPLDLVFSPFEIMAVTLAVAIVAYLVMNGETNWFEGVQLLALYAILAVAAFFLPG
jgi:Ca2+:H+ antiporter